MSTSLVILKPSSSQDRAKSSAGKTTACMAAQWRARVKVNVVGCSTFLVLRRLRQEDSHEVEVSLDYKMSPRPAWVTE